MTVCYGCYVKAGEPKVVNEATVAAAKLIDRIYDEFSDFGGNAHVVVDDWNLGDGPIRWSLDTALVENIHKAGPAQLAAERAALEALLALDDDGRNSALAIHDGFLKP